MQKLNTYLFKRIIYNENATIWALIALLTLIDVVHRIGPISLRMATAAIDDNPILASQVMEYPSQYSYDIYSQIITDTQKNSLLTWVTYLLSHNFGVTYSWIWLVITVLQRALLYISISFIASQINRKKYFKHFAVIGVAATNPYFWNLGWFGSLDNQPYAMWSAMPLLLFAHYFINKRSYKASYSAWLTAFFIHPSLAMLVSTILIITYTTHKRRSIKDYSLKLFSISIIPILYFFLTLHFMPTQIEFSTELKEIAFTNPHLKFFNPITSTYPLLSLRIWLILIAISTIALTFLKQYQDRESFKLITRYVSVSLVFLAAHALFMKTQFMPGILLFGPRITVYLVVILYIYFLKYIYELIISHSKTQKIEGAILYLFPAVALLLLASVNCIMRNANFKIKKQVMYFINISTICLFLILFLQKAIFVLPNKWENHILLAKLFNSKLNIQNTGFVSYYVSGLGSMVNREHIWTFIFSFTLIVAVVYGSRKANSDFKAISFLFLLVISLNNGLNYQKQWSYDGVPIEKVQDFADMQVWSKNNTSEFSNFYLEGASPFSSWRTFSERPRVNPNINWTLYNYPDYAFKHNLYLQNWWKKQIAEKQLEFYGQWNEVFICNSRDMFHTDYVLRSHEQEPMNFPLVYKNNSFKMHKVVCP